MPVRERFSVSFRSTNPQALGAKPPGSWPFQWLEIRRRKFEGKDTGAAIGNGIQLSLCAGQNDIVTRQWDGSDLQVSLRGGPATGASASRQ
jgi:hypothetical protein